MARNAVNKWQAQMEADAAKVSAELPTASGNWISIQNNRLTYKDALVPGDTMDVVVLGYLRENKFYAHAYVQGGDNEAPVCYAFGNDDAKMAPHEDCAEPQSTGCAGCPHNQWGSDGKGKACKNVLRLSMIAAGAEDIPGAEVASFTVPRTSVKNFNAYAKTLTDNFKRPPYGVVTRMALDPKSVGRITFELVKAIEDDDAIGELLEKRKTIKLDSPYAKAEDKPVAAPATRSRFSGRGSKL